MIRAECQVMECFSPSCPWIQALPSVFPLSVHLTCRSSSSLSSRSSPGHLLPHSIKSAPVLLQSVLVHALVQYSPLTWATNDGQLSLHISFWTLAYLPSFSEQSSRQWKEKGLDILAAHSFAPSNNHCSPSRQISDSASSQSSLNI